MRLGVGLGPFYVSGRVGVPRGSGRAMGYLIALPFVVGYFTLKVLVLAVAWLLKQPRNVQLFVLAGVAVMMVLGAIVNALRPMPGTPSPVYSYGSTVPTERSATVAPTLVPVDIAKSTSADSTGSTGGHRGKAAAPRPTMPTGRSVVVVAAPDVVAATTLPPMPVVAAAPTEPAEPVSHSHSHSGSKVAPTTPETSPTTLNPVPDSENSGDSVPTTVEDPSGA